MLGNRAMDATLISYPESKAQIKSARFATLYTCHGIRHTHAMAITGTQFLELQTHCQFNQWCSVSTSDSMHAATHRFHAKPGKLPTKQLVYNTLFHTTCDANFSPSTSRPKHKSCLSTCSSSRKYPSCPSMVPSRACTCQG